MTPIELDGDELQHVGELVRTAKNRFYVPPREDDPSTVPGETVERPDDGSEPDPVIEQHGDQDSTDAPPSQGADSSTETADDTGDQGLETEGHPEVKILGAVGVKGTGDDWPTTKSKEAVIYLATRPDGADGDTLMEALWPREEPNRNRLQTEISRARSVLGEAPGGQPYLPPPKNGIYRLDDRVQTDLDRFRRLVRDAAARPDEATDLLQAALDLVDERPWSGIPKGCYSWASFPTHAVEQSVADAAHKLAQLYLDEGQPSRAISAARTGLVADDHYEALYRDLMEADDWMDPDTVHLFDKLTGGRTTTSAEPRTYP